MGSSFVMLLAFLVGGGGSDLLDYISPEQFWKDKQVTVSVEAMANELKPVPAADVSKLIDDLASPDAQVREQAGAKITAIGPAALEPLRAAANSPIPQVAASTKGIINRIEAANRAASLRRLMAVRALGDMKQREAIPVLEPLLKSNEPFMGEYAAEAIDRIGGKPFHRNHPAQLHSDVYLLPDASRAVAQVLAPPGGPVNIAEALKQMAPAPGMDPATVAQGVQQMLVSAAEQMGNIRLDCLNIGISGEIGPNSGFVTVIGHGTYDARAIGEWMHHQQVPSNHVAGIEVFQPPGAETAFFFVNDHYAAFVASPRGVDLPLEQVITAIRTGQGKLGGVPEMKKLIDASPPGQPVWAAAKVTPSYAQLPVFAPFETIELRSDRKENGLNLVVTGAGQNPDKAKAAAQTVQDGARAAAQSLRQAQQAMPPLKQIADAMESVTCDAKGGTATLTAKVEGVQSGLFLLPMFMMHGEAHPAPAPAQVGAQPVPPAPPQPIPPPKP